MTRILLFIAFSVFLAGCATPYKVPPQKDFACIDFRWGEVKTICKPGQAACQIGNGTIVTEMPRDFGDYDRLIQLGHEVMHVLGAKH